MKKTNFRITPKRLLEKFKKPFSPKALQTLKKALIVATISGAIGFGSYNELVLKPKDKIKNENYRAIAETKNLTDHKPQNLESFYTDEVMGIYAKLISKGAEKVTPQDITLANRELLKHKGVTYFDPVDKVFYIRPHLDFGTTQARAYEVIKESVEFKHLWFNGKIYEKVYDIKATLNKEKPDVNLIRRQISRINNYIRKNGGIRELSLETSVVGSKTNYRLVLHNKLTSEKTQNF